MALVNSGTVIRKQIFPIDYETEASQRLVDASHYGDIETAFKCVSCRFVDVNFVGTVSLKSKTTEIVLNDELSHGVHIGYEEFKTEVTALFLAAHNGNLTLLRKLLNMGANINTRLFRGYPTTASAREGHLKVLEVLINGGASQLACEEALIEASYFGRARFAEIFMQSHMIRPQVAVHALVSASCRGYVEVVDVLIKHGVDMNAIDRTLLQSSKPFLHANVDCNALFAAVVSRQIHVVRLLLQVGVNLDMKAKLGAWSWESETGEEFRVGVGLAEPYPITWCAIEYFESSGSILQMLLYHLSSPNTFHIGRTLLHHAILCNNEKAVYILLNSGAETELATTEEFPIHIASRLGLCEIIRSLISSGCDLDSQTNSGDTAIMICVRYKHEECLRVLASSGADLGIVNSSGECAVSVASSVQWSNVFQRVILEVIGSGKVVRSSNGARFSGVMFATRANDVEGLKKLIENGGSNIDEQNENGFSAAMIAAASGYVEAFKLLLYAGADVLSLRNKYGLTTVNLIDLRQNKCGIFQRVLIEYALVKKRCNDSIIGFTDNVVDPLHRAACYGDIEIVHKLIKEGYDDVNSFDSNGYTPLMLAARARRGEMCKLLISLGAKCDVKNERNETALSLARENGNGKGKGNEAENVILDDMAIRVVLCGGNVKKHTKCGKGKPHSKKLVMVGGVGILRWGKSSKRNVICKEAIVGPSEKFRWNRRRKFDVDEGGIFHVVTTKNKEFHFVCSEGGVEMAELWVRGIRLVTRQVIFGGRDVKD